MEKVGAERRSKEVEREEGTRTERKGEGVEGTKGEEGRKRKSGEAHGVTSERSMDENWTGKD